MRGNTGDLNRPILRFGLFLLPALFTESALGVLSAGAGAPPGSELFDTHVGLGLGLIAIAGWAFRSSFRSADLQARVSSGTAFFASFGTAAVAVASFAVDLPIAGLVERGLSIIALLGAAAMIGAGATSATEDGHPSLSRDDPSAGGVTEVPGLTRAATGAFTVIAVLFLWFDAIGLLLAAALDLSAMLALPLEVNFLGAGLLVTSIALAAWVFAFRRPHEMVRSTFITFQKLFGLALVAEPSGRTENLVVRGPQQVVRHPLYLSILVALAGWGLFVGSTIALIEVLLFVLWFTFVQIPFEERELRALYGDQYARYEGSTPMLIPFPRRRGG